MRSFILLLIFVNLFKLKMSVFLNTSSMFSSYFKTINAYCVKPDYSLAYFQSTVNNFTYSTTDGISILQQTVIPTNLIASQMKYYNGSLFILFGSNNLFVYNDTLSSSNNSTHYFTFTYQILDFDFCNGANNSLVMVLIIANTVLFKLMPIDSSPVRTYSFTENLQKINCIKTIEPTYCFISAGNRLIILDASNPSIYNYIDMDSNVKITAFNIRINQTSSSIYLYLGLNTGVVKQYFFSKGQLTIKRQSKNMFGYSISRVIPHFNGDLIYIFSNETSYVNIITLSGYLHESTNFSFMANFSQNNDIKVNEVSNIQIIVYNPKSEFLLFIFDSNFSNSNFLAQPGLQVACPDGYFYNQSSNYCQSCQYACLTCQEYTGICNNCIYGYFLSKGQCKSCVYDDLVINNTDKCFTSTKLSLFQASQSITPALVSGVVFTYGVFSGSSLIFIFYRLFNFWSLVSLYYFLPINIPYLLQKLLQKIFNVYYSSIFQLFGIQLNISFNTKQRNTNQKLIAASISTDFLQSNADNLIVFAYSVLLICTIFKGVKILVKKRYGIQILEQVNLQACMQQFVGLFITFLIPLPFLLQIPYFLSYNDKLNQAVQFLLLGFVIVFPFLYLAAIQKKKKKVKIITKINKNVQKKQRKNFIQKKKSQKYFTENKKSISFFDQNQGERFLYCCISLATPFFVTIKPIQIFLFGGLILHYLSVKNALKAHKWRINLFIHKTTFMVYHISYIFMYYQQNEDMKFFIAAFSLFLIVFGGIHQLLTAVAQKIAFIIKVCKKAKNNKVGNTLNDKKNEQIQIKKTKQRNHFQKINVGRFKSEIKIKENLNMTNISNQKSLSSKKRIGNEPLIFRTLKEIKENKNIFDVSQQIEEESNKNKKCSINNIDFSQNQNIIEEEYNDRKNKNRMFQIRNKMQNQNQKTQLKINKIQVQGESIDNSSKYHKFKPILITKKYIDEKQMNSKKTIKQKIKLKWSNYIVSTFNEKDDDDNYKENNQIQEIDYKKNMKKSQTTKDIQLKNQQISNSKQKEKLKQIQMNKTSYKHQR